MPNCKNCGSNFPNRTTYNDKELDLHRRSYCLICSPPGTRNGYDLRICATSIKNKVTITGHKECLICKSQIAKKFKNNICSTCRCWYLRYQTKLKAVKFLGGKCSKCNCDDVECLSFHHLDPSIKEFTLSSNYGTKKWEEILEEVKKCELLCYNCHAKHHISERRLQRIKILEYYSGNYIIDN